MSRLTAIQPLTSNFQKILYYLFLNTSVKLGRVGKFFLLTAITPLGPKIDARHDRYNTVRLKLGENVQNDRYNTTRSKGRPVL